MYSSPHKLKKVGDKSIVSNLASNLHNPFIVYDLEIIYLSFHYTIYLLGVKFCESWNSS